MLSFKSLKLIIKKYWFIFYAAMYYLACSCVRLKNLFKNCGFYSRLLIIKIQSLE